PSAFAAKAAFLVAPEWAGGIELVVGVRPNHAGAKLINDFENFTSLFRPNAGAQSVRRIVSTRDCFFGSPEGHHTQDRSENFFLRDAMRGRYTGEKTGW